MLILEGRPAEAVLDGAIGLALATGQHLVLDGPLEGSDRAVALAAIKLSDPSRVEETERLLAKTGPLELRFATPRAAVHVLDLPEPGAVPRVLSSLSWALALSGKTSELRLRGPNYVENYPTFHDLRLAWVPWASQFGLRVALELSQAGFAGESGEMVALLDPAPALTSLHAGHRGLLRQATVIAAVAGGRHEEGLLAAEQAARVLRRQGVIAEAERVPLPVAASAPARPRWAVTVLAEFESSIVAASALAPSEARVGTERDAANAAGDRAAGKLIRFLSRRGALDAWTAERLLLPAFLSAAGLGARAGPPPSSHYTTSEVTDALVELAKLARLVLPVRAVVDGAIGEEGVVVVAPANLA